MAELDLESVFGGFNSFGSSSSSSDLSTLVGSEVDSTELESSEEEDDEFMAELSRQMADYMLQDGDDKEEYNKDEEKDVVSFDSEYSKKEDDGARIRKGTNSMISNSVKELNTVGYLSSPVFPADKMQPIQLYQLENQPKVVVSGNMSNGKRGEKAESIYQTQNNKQQDNQMCKYIGISGINGGLSNNYVKGYPYNGSGMRAVFLGGVGSINASSGTGVFLPRTITPTPDQPRKKSGCSTVLIPTRVLQALEQHFSKVDSSNHHSPQHGKRGTRTQEKEQVQSHQSSLGVTMDHQVSQLPHEWTY